MSCEDIGGFKFRVLVADLFDVNIDAIDLEEDLVEGELFDGLSRHLRLGNTRLRRHRC